jgi:hypothetical protein
MITASFRYSRSGVRAGDALHGGRGRRRGHGELPHADKV